ncbi:CDGSH iron-sulfur domain-containing protein [Mycobacterium sp.]
MPNGETVECDRFMVAICTCRRSKIYPKCDTSHRRCRPAAQANSAERPS